MLNGKFYTGLPPKMIERTGGGSATNRQETHFFWPDDSKVDSAVENRVKRRGSLQSEGTDRAALQRQMSLQENEVDTKGMFQKEFAKSSIQFYDNMKEEGRPSRNRRQEITPKPNATKYQLPECVIDEEYTTAKKKQTFTSKIQFYDFADEDLNKRNNVRKPKTDMNDKKEVERNTKNSPKLQVKSNVRNLSSENGRDNRERYTPERTFESEKNTSQKSLRDAAERGGRETYMFERGKVGREDVPRRIIDHKIDMSSHGRGRDVVDRNNGYEREERLPKKILKTPNKFDRSYEERYEHRERERERDLDQIDNDMRNMRVGTSPRKHVSYRDDNYNDAANERQLYDDDMPKASYRTATTHYERTDSPNRQAGNQQRQQPRSNTPDFNNTNGVVSQYMETGSAETVKKSLNNNKFNNQLQNERKITPKSKSPPTPTATRTKSATTAAEKSPSVGEESAAAAAANFQKHLRSSITFYDGAIVACNDAASAGTNAPTSNNQRRNARSSATQRVSVGLPG